MNQPTNKTFMITTPIYYMNGPPHLGHLYTNFVADTLRFYYTQRGYDVFFLTGTDEYGRNIERAAEAKGVPVKEYVDGNVALFRAMLAEFGIEATRFMRTTSTEHKQAVQKMFATLQERGYIYKGKYNGLYCVGCNQFYLESEAELSGSDKLCPIHGKPLEHVSEESYFFKLASFQEQLLELYARNPNFVRPESRLRETIAFVSGGLMDLSVSRSTVRWGIPVPGDPDHTIYVWLDALTNYITALGYGNDVYDGLDRYWPADLQLMGKDILRFHSVYWPAFLMAAGIPLPKQIFAHGMWISGGRKMSKSLGNVINTRTLRLHFTPEAVRYFVLRQKAFSEDADFNYPALIQRYNGDLASGLGNLASRTLTMIKNACNGVIPPPATDASDESLERIRATALSVTERFMEHLQGLETNRALEVAWSLVEEVDRVLAHKETWNLAKRPEPGARRELTAVLGTAAEALRFLAVLLYPAQPNTMPILWSELGLSGSPASVDPTHLAWGSAGERPMGTIEALYPRIDEEALLRQLEAEGEYKQAVPVPKVAPQGKPKKRSVTEKGIENSKAVAITIDDLNKLDIRVGIVKSARHLAGADRVLILDVDIGEQKPRQIASGIAATFENLDTLVGTRVVVVANLPPRQIRGVMSEGMVLSVTDQAARTYPLYAAESVQAGSKIR